MKDRFAEVNAVLSDCVAEVQARVAAYNKKQQQYHEDKSPVVFSKIGVPQLKAFASEAVANRRQAVADAVVASVVAEAQG